MNLQKILLFLWLGCIVGALAVLPYVHYLGIFPPPPSSYMITLLFTGLQAAILYGITCRLSFFLLKKVDFNPFIPFQPIVRTLVLPGALIGIALSLGLFLVDRYLFHTSYGAFAHTPPFWTVLLASIYGGINEEVLSHLFLLTLFYFIFCKLFKKTPQFFPIFLWVAISLSAFAFAAFHLPVFLKTTANFLSFAVLRILFLNTTTGIVFGWLYCKKGFWMAASAHFTTDLFLHSFFV